MSAYKDIQDLLTPVLLLNWPIAKRNLGTAAPSVAGKSLQLRLHFNQLEG